MSDMKRTNSRFPFFKYLPATLMMLAIFLFSAGQALDLPQDILRLVVNKTGHVIGYAMLAIFYWHAFDFLERKRPLAWVLTVLYAMTDELHQSFVPGRHPSLFDVMVYDNFGALLSLWLAGLFLKHKQPGIQSLVADGETLRAGG